MSYLLPRISPFLILFFLTFVSSNVEGQTVEELLDEASDLYEKEEYQKMFDAAERVLIIDSLNAKGNNYKGIFYEIEGNIPEAKVYYEKAKILDPNFSAPWSNLSGIYMNEGEFDLAIEFARKYASIKPEEAERWAFVSLALYYKSEFDSTIFYANKAIQMDKKEESAYFYKAHAYSSLQKMDSAIASLDQLVAVSPDAKNYFTRGNFKLDNDDSDGAFNDFNTAIKKDSTHTGALSKRAELFFYDNKFEKSKADALKVLEMDPEDDRANYFLGWDEFYLGNEEEAVRRAEFGIKQAKDTWNYNYLLGEYYYINEDFIKAKEAYLLASEFSQLTAILTVRAARATVLSNMNPDDFTIKDGEIRFKKINSNNTATMDKWVRDSDHKFFYDRLLKKYNTDYRSLGFDEYFMLYYGYSSQDGYAPYSFPDLEKSLSLDSLKKEKEYKEMASICEGFLEKNFFMIDVHYYAASAFYNLNEVDKYNEYVFKSNMFMESIIATGDGKSEETAWVVISVDDEYNTMSYFEIPTSGQFLTHNNGHSYDGLRAQDDDENEDNDTVFFFNIDKPFNSLGESLNIETEEKKKKKKKKKKKRRWRKKKN